MFLYVVYDVVARSTIGMVVQEPHDAPAIRSFYRVLADAQSQLAQSPQDYELWCIGRLDRETGQVEGLVPRSVVTGSAWQVAAQGTSPQLVKEAV